MKKNISILLIIFSFYLTAFAQKNAKVDSLLQILNTKITEKQKVNTYVILAEHYSYTDSVQTNNYANKAIELARKIDYTEGILNAYGEIAWMNMVKRNYSYASTIYKQMLDMALEAKNDKYIAKVYSGLGTLNVYEENYANAKDYYFKSLEINKRINNKDNIASDYYNIALVYRNQGLFNEALDYSLKNLEINKELNDKHALSSSYKSIGAIYMRQGKHNKALQYLFDSLKIAEELELGNIPLIIDTIAIVYYEQNKYEKALEYFFKSLKMADNKEDLVHKSALLINIGAVYSEINNPDKALEHYFKALKIQEVIGDKKTISACFINIGEVYVDQKKYEEALPYLQKGLLISKELENDYNIASVLNSMGTLYLKTKDYQKAKNVLNEALLISQKNNFLAGVGNATEALAKVERALGNYKEALKHYELYHATYDSLLGEEKSKQISQLQIQYETEKKEQEIKNMAQQASIQRLELKQANFNKTIFAIVTIVLVLVGLVLYLVNRQKQLALKQRAQNIEQNLLRVQMNPHFIFNAMTSIQDYMNQGNAKQAGIYLVKFSKLIRQVLDNSRNEFINLDQEINMLDNYLSIQNLKREHPFTFTIEVEEELIPEEITIPPMFAQPFIENAVEHGVAHIQEGAMITLHFSLQGEHLQLKITDNGSGIEEAMKIKRADHRSHAIKITEERIELYKRMTKKKIDFAIQNLAPAPGTQVTFNLPYQYI